MPSVLLDDVDDFISPSQACINPLFTSDKTPTDKNASNKSKVDTSPSGNSRSITNERKGNGVIPKSTIVRRRRRRTPVMLQQSTRNEISQKQEQQIEGDEIPTPQEINEKIEPTIPASKRIIAKPALSYHRDSSTPNDISSVSPSQTETKSSPKTKASVSVADCLACSGCVTSAETVLVAQHSSQTLIEKCEQYKDSKKIVFTISPASVADLARVLYGDAQRMPSMKQVHQRLSTYLARKFHAKSILDGRIPQDISLLESAIEFCDRYRYVHGISNQTQSTESDEDVFMADVNSPDKKKPKGDLNIILANNEAATDERITLDTPSIALSATETRFLIRSNTNNNETTAPTTEAIVINHNAGIDQRLPFLNSNPPSPSENVIPMLASSCPGFVCYVEKTVPKLIPYLCTVKSPMAIAGGMFKHKLYSQTKVSPKISEFNNLVEKDIFHVAIMPCHDKKLEAERKDFAWETFNQQELRSSLVRDVDLVITTDELMDILINDATEINSPSVEDSTIMESDTVKDAKMTKSNHLESVDEVSQSSDAKIKTVRDYLETCSDMNNEMVKITDIEKHAESTEQKNVTSQVLDSSKRMLVGSGAYAEFIFRYACQTLFGFSIDPNDQLPWKRVDNITLSNTGSINPMNGNLNRRRVRSRAGNKNQDVAVSDFCEVILYKRQDGTCSLSSQMGTEHAERDEILLRFAVAYGFKNVQLLQHELSKEIPDDKKSSFHYVEMMACPSGCLNGGGQIKEKQFGKSQAVTKREVPAERRKRVSTTLNLMEQSWHGKRHLEPKGSYEDLEGEIGQSLLHTRFHVVPKLELSTGATAGVAVDDTKW